MKYLFLVPIALLFFASCSEDLVVDEQPDFPKDDSWVQGRCAMIGQVRCADTVLDKAGYLSVELLSNQDVLITRVEVKSNADSIIKCDDEEKNIELLSTKKTITFSCGDASYGDLDAEINIYFTELDSGVSKIIQGELINIEPFD